MSASFACGIASESVCPTAGLARNVRLGGPSAIAERSNATNSFVSLGAAERRARHGPRSAVDTRAVRLGVSRVKDGSS
jgi:hypothetical protein